MAATPRKQANNAAKAAGGSAFAENFSYKHNHSNPLLAIKAPITVQSDGLVVCKAGKKTQLFFQNRTQRSVAIRGSPTF
jgi:hypothetical protein